MEYLKITDILKGIEDMASKFDIIITYEVVDQESNGYAKEVLDGKMPKFTYTVYVNKKDGGYIYSESFDKLYDALNSGMVNSIKYLQSVMDKVTTSMINKELNIEE